MVCSYDSSMLSDDFKKKLEKYRNPVLQAFESLKNKEGLNAEMTAWFDSPKNTGFTEFKAIEQLLESIEVAFDSVVVIGVGGSINGAKAIYEALTHKYMDSVDPTAKQMFFTGDNLSEKSMVEVMDLLNERDPLVVVISKSGDTIETNLAFRIIEDWLSRRYRKEYKERIICCTSSSSSLAQLSQQRGYKLMNIPEGVGGRFSVLTAVGLLPLTLCGLDTESLLYGADRLYSELRDVDIRDHAVINYAAYRKVAWEDDLKVEFLAFHEPKLSAFVEWWKQLFAESEAKDKRGLLPVGFSYSSDLHSLGQYLQDGPLQMIETFLEIKDPAFDPAQTVERRITPPADEDNPSRLAPFLGKYLTEINHAAFNSSKLAHFERGVSCFTLRIEKLDAYHLGYLLAFFKVACALSSLLLDVNPYNQPGVEVYKQKLANFLAR